MRLRLGRISGAYLEEFMAQNQIKNGLDLYYFPTPLVFNNCNSLRYLNLSNWDTNLGNFSWMFQTIRNEIIDWHYDGTNYANWTLTEEQTRFSGTFPWNK